MTATDRVDLNSPARRFWRTVIVVTLTALVIWLTHPNAFSITTSIFIIAGAMLVLVRPCRMTWGFFLFALGSNRGGVDISQFLSPTLLNAGWWLLMTLVYGGLRVAGLWVFTSRFPGDSASGWRSHIDRAAPVAGLVGFTASGLASLALFRGLQSFGTGPMQAAKINLLLVHNPWNVVSNVVDTTFFAVGMLSLVGGYFQMTASDRQRLRWVVGGFAISLLADAYQQIAKYLPSAGWPASWDAVGYHSDVLDGLHLLIPATVVYAVLRYRVFDVKFVISRALVLGTLTTSFVGVFALVDWFFHKVLDQQRLAVYAEVAVALAFGFGLNGMHRRLDAFIDRVLFRRRHLAEARLERIAAGIPHATSDSAVNEALVEEPSKAFQLTSAAVFRRRDGDGFARAAAVGWPSETADQLDTNDRMVLQMQGERGPMRLRDVDRRDDNFPKDVAAPIIAFPLLVRHQLEGLALYGAHVTGEDIDPDEVGTLERLSTSAAAAYDHLEVDALRRELEDAKRRIESLEQRHGLLATD